MRTPLIAAAAICLAVACDSPGDQCDSDEGCLFRNTDVGKRCQNGYCEFPNMPRVAAPNFCLKVVNPKRADFDQKHCLAQHKGRVTMLFFGQWLS